ncbi:hypothetical protein [Paenibacillus sp. FSL L8-0709]|uniref:hypothetical protein n=1 Tax=Paenibacillus sp. FSL L8-0709 TaxID=2975312 RepID=UPI0030F79156
MPSDFQKKLDLALANVREEHLNPFGIGISDGLLSFLARSISMDKPPKSISVSDEVVLFLYPHNRLNFRNGKLACRFFIEPQSKHIRMILALKIDFINAESEPTKIFASGEITLSASIEPFMKTSYQESLGLSVTDIELDGNIEYPVLQEDEIIRHFQSMELFKDYVEKIVDKIKNKDVTSEFNTVVPSVFSEMELPNTWKYLSGYEATFLKFDYAEGLLESEPSGYLFMLFSVRSLMAIPSCNCTSSGLKDERDDDVPPSEVFEEVDRWVSIGFSQRAFNEILRPYADYDRRTDNKFSVGKNFISASVSSWMQYHAGKLNILSDRIEVDVEANAGGDVNAYARDPLFGGKYGYEAAKLTVDIDKIKFKGFITTRFNKERKGTELVIQPDVEFSDPNVEIDGVIPWPINEIAELVLERVGSRALDKMKDNINSNMTVSLLFPRLNGIGYFSFEFDHVDFYENSSVIVTGIAGDD